MHSLQFKFGRWLYGSPNGWRHQALIFHRWLPNGRVDQIELPTSDEQARVYVWVERRGYVDDNRIVYDHRRSEVDLDIVERQGDIEVKLLHGELLLDGISTKDYEAVLKHAGFDYNDVEFGEYYQSLGKRVNKALFAALKPFLSLLRYGYGQHWIDDLRSWDSRTYTLGDYLRTSYQIMWTVDSGATWHLFLPSKGPVNVGEIEIGVVDPYWEFLTSNDWDDIRRLVANPYEITTAHEVLSRAHALRDERNYRHALIEGITALEIAVDAYLDKRLKASQRLTNATQQLRGDAKLPLRLSAVVMSTDNQTSDIDRTFDAIDARNAIVHESADPPMNAEELLDATFRVVGSLLHGPRSRFPRSYMSGTMMPPERWEQERNTCEPGGQ